ncbi:uncharacterized protein LOC126379742 [Pectinophora gossypiella]|uniref:uncharacterized protein LOC126379742 n=1 Tax=Pectinophora gossypiella TaxID=13191 RepID=UPI00214E340D|nr:uncharacterized protein LOC126379742 [Pectinophora gossypiella]
MEKEFRDARSDDPADVRDRVSTTPSVNIDVDKVGVRIPPFWPEEPEIWFANVEGQFLISGITSDTTKFYYVLGQLENRYSREVKDIIVRPPATGKYEKLKTELIKRLSASNEKKIKQLLMHEELGDRKPSQFLRHLKSLAGDDVPDDFIKTIWTSRLPRSIQTVLAGQASSAVLDDLADLADRVNDIAPSSPVVAAASTSQTQQTGIPGSVLSDLTREIAELRRQFQQLSGGSSRQSRSRGRRQSRSRSTSRSQSNYRKFPLCWYHWKYGEKASRCIRPCDYKSENARGSR